MDTRSCHASSGVQASMVVQADNLHDASDHETFAAATGALGVGVFEHEAGRF